VSHRDPSPRGPHDKTMNIHSDYIDKRIIDLKKKHKSNKVKFVDCTHEEFIKDTSSCIFTNFVRDTFTNSYLKKYPCSICSEPSTDRCHGVSKEESRPALLKKALEKVWPDTSVPISLLVIKIAFLEEHKSTSFTLKCNKCHKKESSLSQ